MSNFVAGLTNDDPSITAPAYKQYRYVQYSGIVPVFATASVSFPPSENNYRYVILQPQPPTTQALCVMEVKVFLRGSFPATQSTSI